MARIIWIIALPLDHLCMPNDTGRVAQGSSEKSEFVEWREKPVPVFFPLTGNARYLGKVADGTFDSVKNYVLGFGTWGIAPTGSYRNKRDISWATHGKNHTVA